MDRTFLTCRVEIFRDIQCVAIIEYTISRQKLANKASCCVESGKYTPLFVIPLIHSEPDLLCTKIAT